MEQLSKEEVLYDEHEERLKKTKARRRRTIRRRHRLHLIIALGIVLLILLYFASDLSKVRSLRVEGNRFYSDEQICEMAGVGYDTRYLRPAFLMENALKGGSLIEDVQVEKSWNGDIRIKVEEKHVIGYLVQEDAYVLLCSSGEQITLQEDEIGSIVNYPLLNGFSDEQLDSIAQAFDEVSEEVGAELIERISEILPYETSFNQNMMKIVMRDGNTLYSGYDSVGLLQSIRLRWNSWRARTSASIWTEKTRRCPRSPAASSNLPMRRRRSRTRRLTRRMRARLRKRMRTPRTAEKTRRNKRKRALESRQPELFLF
ncbi:MAG: cell division protein FtsQ/DivIB [Merdibacter sp.]